MRLDDELVKEDQLRHEVAEVDSRRAVGVCAGLRGDRAQESVARAPYDEYAAASGVRGARPQEARDIWQQPSPASSQPDTSPGRWWR